MLNYIKQYKDKGIVVIPGVFTSEECDEIKKQAYLMNPQEIVDKGYPHNPIEKAYNKTSLYFFPAIANEYLNKIRTDKRLVDIVKTFLGDNVKQINNQIYFREAGDKDQFAWHQDIIFRESDMTEIGEHYLQTIIAVDDIKEDNGAIEFIEGSHLTGEILGYPNNLRKFEREGRKGTKYLANKGDVLLWTSLTIHGSESNQSKSDRMTYMNGFARTEASPRYPEYIREGKVVEKLDPTQIP